MHAATKKPHYYKSSNQSMVIYYDKDCNGHGSEEAKFIFDVNEGVDLSREYDIDGDSACVYSSQYSKKEYHISFIFHSSNAAKCISKNQKNFRRIDFNSF